MIGDVICHGKKEAWAVPNAHYHRGMLAGQNTLNALCMRCALLPDNTLVPDMPCSGPKQTRAKGRTGIAPQQVSPVCSNIKPAVYHSRRLPLAAEQAGAWRVSAWAWHHLSHLHDGLPRATSCQCMVTHRILLLILSRAMYCIVLRMQGGDAHGHAATGV